MIVVSDSTPLISLMKAARLDTLYELFGEVLIPEAVFHEVTTNDNFPEEAEQIRNSAFIKVVSVGDMKSVILLQRATGLDRGESEAIIYADAANISAFRPHCRRGLRFSERITTKKAPTIVWYFGEFDEKITESAL